MNDKIVPLLNFVIGLQLGNRDKNYNGLLATTNINFSCGRDLQDAKLGLEFGDIVFEVNQCLNYVLLNFIRGCLWGVGGAENFVGHFV